VEGGTETFTNSTSERWSGARRWRPSC